MSAPLKDIQKEVINQINQITIKWMGSFVKIWEETFGEALCEDFIRTLPEHVEIFYNDVMNETNQRQDKIRQEIKKLQNEACDLQRKLQVEVGVDISNDIPLYSLRSKVDENLQDLREELKSREDTVNVLLVEQDFLCNALDEEPKELHFDPLPTVEKLKEFRAYLNELLAIKDRRSEEIRKLRQDIKVLSKTLEIPTYSFEKDATLLTDPHITLSKKNIIKLVAIRKDLEKQMKYMKDAIDDMRVKLEKLWDMLEVPVNDRKEFEKFTTYTQITYDKLSSEVQRCEHLRQINIKHLIDKIREEINYWWDKVLYSDTEKRRFSNYTTDCYTEDLLDLHEMVLKDIQDFYYKNETIFKLFEQRTILWDRMEALEAKASEPGRYNNRGGQLLKEEKERKALSKKLPDIEKELIKNVTNYEKCENKKFTIYGESVAEMIQRDWQRKEQANEELKIVRKKGAQTTIPFKTSILQNHNSTTNKAIRSISNLAAFSTTSKTPPKTSLPTKLKMPTFTAKPRLSGTKLRSSGAKLKEHRVSRGKVVKKRATPSNILIPSDINYNYYFKDYLGTRSPYYSSMVVKSKQDNHRPASSTKSRPLHLVVPVIH